MKIYKYIIFALILFSCISATSFSQVVKNDLLLTLGYYNNNNQVQYLTARAKTKIDGKFTMVPGVYLNFYITAESPANFLGKATTNAKGEATVLIPPSAKEEWLKSAKQSFIIVSDLSKLYDITKANAAITKAKLKIDTAEDKKITATLMELKDSVWSPVKGADVKIAVKRMDGDLNVSETPTYTTDSLGMVSADFKRDGLPGDVKGNLILIAKVEDNDSYGNLSSEKSVKWGSDFTYVSDFDNRSLFARRGHSPIWLELVAYSIIAGVWLILVYLFFQIRKLKNLGV
jgi:hypothetical protein